MFGGSGIVAYPARDISKGDYTDYTKFSQPDTNFKTPVSPNTAISTLIGDITNGSNTRTAEALYLSYMTLRADAQTNADLPNKLNVIVLFTDGLPNGVTNFANSQSWIAANQVMKSASGCTDLSKGSNARWLARQIQI